MAIVHNTKKIELLKDSAENPLPMSSSSSTDLIFDLETLGDSILIISDPNRGILSMYLQPGTASHEETQVRGLMRMVRMEFNDFKNELTRGEHQVEHVSCNLDPDELIVQFPSPTFYDAFMQQLVDKKLLPPSYLQHLKQDSEKPTTLQTPASEKSKAKAINAQVDANEARAYTYSPFRTTLEIKNEPWMKKR